MESAPTKKIPYLTTFKVCDKKPEKVYIHQNSTPDAPRNCVEHLEPYKTNKCIRVLQGTKFPHPSIPLENGFVSTVVQCYNTHHNLVLRPEDVWLAIMTQFSFYINKHAEKFRNKFVNFEGQKELVVCAAGVLDNTPYDLLVKLMSDKIDENLVDGTVKGWILPDFSTTTEDDKVTFGVVFMASMKKYFKYKFCLCCGIPNITLDGTVEDWKEIETRVQKLKEYELEDWVSMLEPILSQFTQAKSGKVDLEFWNRICSNVGGGSGPRYLSGWITAFCRFDEEGNVIGKEEVNIWGEIKTENAPWPYVNTNDIPNGFVEVDVTIDDNGTEYKSVMFSGHFTASVEKDEVTLKPAAGWAIVLKHPLPGEEEKK
jgi:hypothetical protein